MPAGTRLNDLLDELPPGSRIPARDWARIRALHAAADELECAGEIMAARARGVEALRLAESLAGNQDPGLGACFFHFAEGVERTGDLPSAEQHYNAASGLLRVTEGEPTPLKLAVLQACGMLYMKMQLGWRAIVMLDWARAHAQKLHGPTDPSVGRALMCLGMAYEIAGVEDEAIAHYDLGIDLLGRAWGPSHPSVQHAVWARADLAFWRAIKGADRAGVEEALATIRAGLRQLEQEAAHDDPGVAERRAQLGVNLVVAEQEAEGAALLADAVAILEAAGRPVPAFRRRLAKVQLREGMAVQALAQLRRATVEESPLGHRLAHGSECERHAALGLAMVQLDQFLDAVLLANAGDDAAIAGEACNLVLSRKALGADLLVVQREATSRIGDPELRSLMAKLAELRAAQADGSLEGAAFDAQLAVEIERTEWEIASRVPAMDARAQIAFTGEVAARALPPASVLIEFVRFERQACIREPADAAAAGSRAWYAAFVIPAGAPQAVRLVDLGAAAEIEALIRAYRGTLARADVRDDAPTARALGSRSRAHDQGSNGRALRERLFDRLRSAIGDRRRIFIAPDGDVCWVPFEALPAEDGRFLTDGWDISYLSTGRDLAPREVGATPVRPGAPVVMADPDYDAQPPRRGGAAQAGEEKPMAGAAELRDGLTRAGIRFGRLPGTRAEGIAVASLLHVQPLLGADASEPRLKAIASPLVLHVATHGFFLPGSATAPPILTPSRGDLEAAAARNPLVRSGVALSGANAWLTGATSPSCDGNGLVHGEDVVALDLTATELVVLSACQTGLGDVVPGEGVVGLRRAFRAAGARSLVLSLWSVPDEQTRMLMTAFYEELLGGKGRAASLRKAQRRVRAQFPDPFYWAAFICVGDPGPIGHLDAGGERARAREQEFIRSSVTWRNRKAFLVGAPLGLLLLLLIGYLMG